MIISICDICGSEIKETNVKLLEIRSAIKNNKLHSELMLNECHEKCINDLKAMIIDHIHGKKISDLKKNSEWSECLMSDEEKYLSLKDKSLARKRRHELTYDHISEHAVTLSAK